MGGADGLEGGVHGSHAKLTMGMRRLQLKWWEGEPGKMQTKVSTPRSADGGVGGGKGSGFGVQGRHRRGGKGAKRSAGGGQLSLIHI